MNLRPLIVFPPAAVQSPRTPWLRRGRLGLPACAAVFACAAAALACDTPVCRYAMYNWLPEPYWVVVIERESGAAGNELGEWFAAHAETEPAQANLRLVRHDPSDRQAFDGLPDPVRLALDEAGLVEDAPADQPVAAVVSPRGGVLFRGPLSSADLAALIDSPSRREINARLDRGDPCVLVVLAGASPDGQAECEAAVAELIRRAAAGEIEPDRLGVDPGEEPPQAEPFELGVVRLARDDPDEAWLVRMLLDVEDDLTERSEPMVFAVYGRGRAMPPYIGQGITAENLSQCLSFITGACSCQVKEQNPGLDLLTIADWESAAERLALRVGEEEGNARLLEDSLASALSVIDVPDAQPLSREPPGPAVAANEEGGAGAAAEQPEGDERSGAESLSAAADAAACCDRIAGGAADGEADCCRDGDAGARSGSFAWRHMPTLAATVAAMGVGLVVASMVLLGRRR